MKKLMFLISAVLAAGVPLVATAQQQAAPQRSVSRVTADPAPELAQQAPVVTAKGVSPLVGTSLPPVAQPTGGAARSMPLPMAPPDLKGEALDRIAPMTPKEILELRRDLDERAKAMNQSIEAMSKPVRRQVTLDLSPGSTPEVIRISYAQGSILSFVDAAGRPWKVLKVENFHPTGLDADLFGENSVSVGLKVAGARAGSLAVLLEGMNAPVMFMFNTAQPESDYAVEVQLPRYLPGMPAPVGAVSMAPTLGATMLMDYLLNTPPKAAKPLITDSRSVQAWQISDQKMVVRAEGWVPVPVFTRHQSSQTGVNVFEVPLSPFVLVSTRSTNALNRVSITGFNSTTEQKSK